MEYDFTSKENGIWLLQLELLCEIKEALSGPSDTTDAVHKLFNAYGEAAREAELADDEMESELLAERQAAADRIRARMAARGETP